MKKVEILVVEDDAGVRRQLMREMSIYGLSVVGVETAEEAVELLEREADIVIDILDYWLPKLTELEAVKAVRRAAPRATLLIHTGNDSSRDCLRALSYADGWYVKARQYAEFRGALDAAIVRRLHRNCENVVGLESEDDGNNWRTFAQPLEE